MSPFEADNTLVIAKSQPCVQNHLPFIPFFDIAWQSLFVHSNHGGIVRRSLLILIIVILIAGLSFLLSCTADTIDLSLSADPSTTVTVGESITVIADGTFSDEAVHWYANPELKTPC